MGDYGRTVIATRDSLAGRPHTPLGMPDRRGRLRHAPIDSGPLLYTKPSCKALSYYHRGISPARASPSKCWPRRAAHVTCTRFQYISAPFCSLVTPHVLAFPVHLQSLKSLTPRWLTTFFSTPGVLTFSHIAMTQCDFLLRDRLPLTAISPPIAWDLRSHRRSRPDHYRFL